MQTTFHAFYFQIIYSLIYSLFAWFIIMDMQQMLCTRSSMKIYIVCWNVLNAFQEIVPLEEIPQTPLTSHSTFHLIWIVGAQTNLNAQRNLIVIAKKCNTAG